VGVLDMIASRVPGGETVEFHPTGASMVPLTRSRQRVAVARRFRRRSRSVTLFSPGLPERCTCTSSPPSTPAGTASRSATVAAGVNGWTSQDKVYGICTAVDGIGGPHLPGKIRQP
jgi:hypothetical protein